MFKKTVSALLAVAMAATALAGCSGDAGSSQGGTESQSGSQGSDSKYADFLTSTYLIPTPTTRGSRVAGTEKSSKKSSIWN